MTERLSALEHAMLSERDGYQFYAMAAGAATDPGAASTFEHLAQEELQHFNALQRAYRSILETGTWDPDTAWDAPWTPETTERIFSEDFRRRIRGQHLEMAALSIGLLLEKEARQFYTRQAAETADEALAALFRELAQWEDGHYEMLLRQDESLREEYWAQNRFEPLD